MISNNRFFSVMLKVQIEVFVFKPYDKKEHFEKKGDDKELGGFYYAAW